MLENTLKELQQREIEIWVTKDKKLGFRAPQGKMSREIQEMLKENKQSLISYLSAKRDIVHEEEARYDKFPLTDMQSAYYSGMQTTYELGGTSCHTYLELELEDIDINRFQQAWHKTIEKHDMLRAMVHQDGTQEVLESVEMPILEVSQAEELEKNRQEMSNMKFHIGSWLNHLIRVTKLENKSIIHFAVDMLVADFVSVNIILNDILTFYYEGNDAYEKEPYTFRDVVVSKVKNKEKKQQSEAYKKDKLYWKNKLQTIPDRPQLPVNSGIISNENVSFTRYQFHLQSKEWEALKQQAFNNGITVSNSILCAFSEILRYWSETEKFGLSVTLMDRKEEQMDIVGDFTAVEILTVNQEGESFSERAKKLQEDLLEDLSHTAYTGIEVLRELNRMKREKTLFPVVYTSTIGTIDNRSKYPYLYGKEITFGKGVSRTPQVWIDCHVIDSGDCLEINWDVRDGIFKESVITDMLEEFHSTLVKLASEREIWFQKRIVTCNEQTLEKRKEVNHTQKDVELGTLYSGFLRNCEKNSHKVALIYRNKTYTYQNIRNLVGNIQVKLKEKGVKRGSYVIVDLPRGIYQIAAILATICCGAAYVPVDYKQPKERKYKIADNLSADCVVCREDIYSDVDIEIINIEKVEGNQENEIQVENMSEEEIAYVIYTSGTTGTPKGVAVSHKAAMNTIVDVIERLKLDENSVALGVSNVAFDLSVFDIFAMFTCGGTLVLLEEEDSKNPEEWIRLVETYEVNVWNSVPALFEMLLSQVESQEEQKLLKSLSYVLLSGDVIGRDIPKRLRNINRKCRLISLGGATEAAIWSIYYDLTDYSKEKIPYGYPLSNQRFYVCKENGTICPNYVKGEILIAGDGLAQGYVMDSELMKEKFSVEQKYPERVYKTGDIGYYDESGLLYIEGRLDNQIKINGHRIEIGEIENAINELKEVDRCAVVSYKEESGASKLAAFMEGTTCSNHIQGEGENRHEGEVIREKGNEIMNQIDWEQFAHWKKYSELTAMADMLWMFRRVNVFQDYEQWFTKEEIHTRVGETKKYVKSVNRMLEVLEKEQYVLRENQKYQLRTSAAQLLERDKLWAEFETIESKFQYSRVYFEYQKKSGGSILEQVREDMNALNLFFPEGKTDVALSAYKDNMINEKLNEVVSTIVNERNRDAKVEILEIGAGVGGTTIPVVSNLENYDLSYWFTDVSNFFLNNAREKFEKYDFMNYQLFDINKNCEEQGVKENTFDLILCANVLHNSINIPDVLRKINKLLKTNGTLIIIEATKESYALMTSLELKGGLDHFTDHRKDNNVIFTSCDKWQDEILQAGFEIEGVFPERKNTNFDSGQSVFCCRKRAEQKSELSEAEMKKRLSEKLPHYMVPTNYYWIHRLPLNINGKIDKKVLKKQAEECSVADIKKKGEEKEGTSELTYNEKRMADIWKTLLHIENISAKDNFYEVGGDSLLIAQVVSNMKKLPEFKEMEWNVLMKAVIDNPTLSGMASLLQQKAEIKQEEKGEKDKDDFVRVYKAGKEKQDAVIGFFHAGTGRLLDYQAMSEMLVKQTQETTKIVGFTHGKYEDYLRSKPQELILERARLYADYLLRQETEQFVLIGYCSGGFMALEAAKILKENGKKVFLVMIDSHLCLHKIENKLLMEFAYGQSMGIDMDKTIYAIPQARLREALEQILQGQHRDVKKSELVRLSGDFDDLGQIFAELADYSQEERMKKLFHSIENPVFNGQESTLAMLRVLYDIYELSFKGMMHYMPDGMYTGDILYFLASEKLNNFYPDTREDMERSDFTLGNVEVIMVEGDHASIVNEENSKLIVEKILTYVK